MQLNPETDLSTRKYRLSRIWPGLFHITWSRRGGRKKNEHIGDFISYYRYIRIPTDGLRKDADSRQKAQVNAISGTIASTQKTVIQNYICGENNIYS